MNDKIYVIAGNRIEYDMFIRRKSQQLWREGNTPISLSDFVFVHNRNQLRGRRNVHGYFVGTYYQRSDFQELKHEICTINMVPLSSLP